MGKVTKRLLVPKVVSFGLSSKRGYQPRGTKAFVEQGTRVPGRGSHFQKWQRLSEIAQNAHHFIKRLSPRQKRIREALERAGIRVEKVTQDLKNGTALFEKEGFALNSKQGQEVFAKNRMAFITKAEEAIAKMHSMGITHNHLHGGNFAITTDGHVILLDLGMARMSKIPDKPKKGWAVRKFRSDLWSAAESLALLYAKKRPGNTWMKVEEANELAQSIVNLIVVQYSVDLQKRIGREGLETLRKRHP